MTSFLYPFIQAFPRTRSARLRASPCVQGAQVYGTQEPRGRQQGRGLKRRSLGGSKAERSHPVWRGHGGRAGVSGDGSEGGFLTRPTGQAPVLRPSWCTACKHDDTSPCGVQAGFPCPGPRDLTQRWHQGPGRPPHPVAPDLGASRVIKVSSPFGCCHPLQQGRE